MRNLCIYILRKESGKPGADSNICGGGDAGDKVKV